MREKRKIGGKENVGKRKRGEMWGKIKEEQGFRKEWGKRKGKI